VGGRGPDGGSGGGGGACREATESQVKSSLLFERKLLQVQDEKNAMEANVARVGRWHSRSELSLMRFA